MRWISALAESAGGERNRFGSETALPGATAVLTKFQDRKTAVTRIWNAIQNLGDAAAIQCSVRQRGNPDGVVLAREPGRLCGAL